MAVSGITQNYNTYAYQWQQQKLQSTGAEGGSSGGNASSAASGYQGRSTVYSLVELAQYAMNAMGVGKGERVTFSQIQNFKSQLETEYGDLLKKGLDGLGVAADAAFSISVDKNGKVLVDSNHPDKEKIQKYFDANPRYGKKIREDLDAAGVSAETPVQFSVGAGGSLSVTSQKQNRLQQYFDKNAAVGEDLQKAFKDLGVDTSKPYTLKLDEHGLLSVDGDHPDKGKIQQYLDENPDVAANMRGILEKQGLAEGTECRISIAENGKVTASVTSEDAQEAAIRNYLVGQDYGGQFKKGLAAMGVDKSIQFRLTLDEKGKILVVSDHPDKEKVQKFFDDNPELAKKYAQIQALADLDSARKSMAISPTDLRKRIELESMAAWWENSGSSGSSIGAFSGGAMSVLSGLNAKV